MLAAWIKYYHQTFFYKLSGLIFPVVSIAFILMMNSIGNVLVSKDQNHLFFPSTFGFTLVSISLALLIPFFDKNEINNQLSKIKVLHFGVTITAILSYCIYLIHIPIYEYFYKYLDGKIPFKVNVALMLMTVYSIACISYFLIERPIQRWVSNNESQS
jgi:peptidoglycan/LPS O-acetylase OafA/YrhL